MDGGRTERRDRAIDRRAAMDVEDGAMAAVNGAGRADLAGAPCPASGTLHVGTMPPTRQRSTATAPQAPIASTFPRILPDIHLLIALLDDRHHRPQVMEMTRPERKRRRTEASKLETRGLGSGPRKGPLSSQREGPAGPAILSRPLRCRRATCHSSRRYDIIML